MQNKIVYCGKYRDSIKENIRWKDGYIECQILPNYRTVYLCNKNDYQGKPCTFDSERQLLIKNHLKSKVHTSKPKKTQKKSTTEDEEMLINQFGAINFRLEDTREDTIASDVSGEKQSRMPPCEPYEPKPLAVEMDDIYSMYFLFCLLLDERQLKIATKDGNEFVPSSCPNQCSKVFFIDERN